MGKQKYNRIFIIVVDSLGVGALNDAPDYGDANTDTLGHISQNVGEFKIPNLQKLGIANLHGLKQVAPVSRPMGYYTKLNEASTGKDTMTGHWEMMGLHITKPFRTFTETGFPEELLEELSRRTGRVIIGNKSASGTEILDELAEEEIAEGHMIVYTSADSVLQICGNEETFGLEELYRCCEIAREMLVGKHGVGRVIARPFNGEYPFTRTANRHDFSLLPPADTMLNLLRRAGYDTVSVGKIFDIFAGSGISESHRTTSNTHGMQVTKELQSKDFSGLCFVNLVDFDMKYGHRNDVAGYAAAATEFDGFLSKFIEDMKEEDVLLITADHGCDPATPSTDHSREYTPMLIYGNGVKSGVNLGTRSSFADISATVLEYFGVAQGGTKGESFLKEVLK